MSFSLTADHTGPAEEVVGVELTIDGVLVLAARLGLPEFPMTLGIRPNIPQQEVRDLVWGQVRRDLTDQGVLDPNGQPHPAVAAMIHTLSLPDRTLEGRWWRPDMGDVMVRFAVCRKDESHVIAVRDGDLLVLQRVAPQVGLAAMVTAVLGSAEHADVEPMTGVARELASCTTEAQLAQFRIGLESARRYIEIITNPRSWAEIIAGERQRNGSFVHTPVAAGVLDSAWGRVVSLPRRVGGELYGSFLPGTSQNLELSLEGLLLFLPAGTWFDDDETPFKVGEEGRHAPAPPSASDR